MEKSEDHPHHHKKKDEMSSDDLSDSDTSTDSEESSQDENDDFSNVAADKGRFSQPFNQMGKRKVGVLYIDDDPELPPGHKELCRLCTFYDE